METINTALSRWSALEVTAEVERWMAPALFGKQGRAIKKLSQSMGGIVLKVNGGVCRGRASTPEAAREATRKLEERVRVIERSTLVGEGEGRERVLSVGSFGRKLFGGPW